VRSFVSPRGSDDAPGTRAQPFATLVRARDAVRALKARGELSAPVEVLLRRGTCRMSEPLLLGLQDSGTEVCDSDMRDGALLYLGAAAIWVGHGAGNHIHHNEVQGDFQ